MTRNKEQHLRSDILSQHDRWVTRKKERRKMERKRRKIERKKKKDGKKRNPWCDDCNAEYQGDCPQCGPLTVINDHLWKGNYLPICVDQRNLLSIQRHITVVNYYLF